MPDSSLKLKDAVANVSLLAAIASATLWDFRLANLRIFDGLAIVLLGFWFVLKPESVAGFLQRRRDYWLLLAVIIVYAAAGFILQGHKSSLAIMALAAIGFVLAGRPERLQVIGPYLWPLVCVHIVFFLIQFIGYYGFGQIIDFQNATGNVSRIMLSTNHMRAAGLFQEANSYCLNLLVVTSVAILWRPHRILTTVAVLTAVLSESIWGMGVAILLLVFNETQIQHSLRRRLIALFASTIVIAVLFNAFIITHISAGLQVPHFYYRILTIANDASLRERYIQPACAQIGKAEPASQTGRIAGFVFGHGLSTKYFEECLPANGLSLLFKSFGAIGILALLAGFAAALRGLPIAAKLYAAAIIGFSFTSYPLMTYLIFWLWIPIIIALLRRNASGSDLPA